MKRQMRKFSPHTPYERELSKEQLVYLPDHYEDKYLVENHQAIRVLLNEIKRLDLKQFARGTLLANIPLCLQVAENVSK